MGLWANKNLKIRNVVYMFKRKYVVLITVFDKNKGIKIRKKERKKERRIKNNDKLKQNETNSN